MGKEWKRSRSRSMSRDRLPAQYRRSPSSETERRSINNKPKDRKRQRSPSPENYRDSYKSRKITNNDSPKNHASKERDLRHGMSKKPSKDLPRKPKKLDNIQKTLLRLAGGYCEENVENGSGSEKGKKKRKKSGKHSKKKHKKKHKRKDSSSDSDRNDSDGSSSNDDASMDSEDEKMKKKKSKHKKKHSHKKDKKKERKREAKKKKAKRDKKKKKESNKRESSSSSSSEEERPVANKAESKRPLVPLTKEEYDKQQSVVKRVYDPDTGRNRLIKGDGEVIEEIVSHDRHKEINRKSTKGDGEFFQKTLGISSRS